LLWVGFLHGILRFAQRAQHPVATLRKWARFASKPAASDSTRLIGHILVLRYVIPMTDEVRLT
jgi:hypothetical protein